MPYSYIPDKQSRAIGLWWLCNEHPLPDTQKPCFPNGFPHGLIIHHGNQDSCVMGPFIPTRHARNLDFTKGFQWSHAGFCLRSRGTLIRILCPLTRKACFPNGFWPIPRVYHGFQGGVFSAKPDLLVVPLFLHESWGWFFLPSTPTYRVWPVRRPCYIPCVVATLQ